MTRAVIIDDEKNHRNSLKSLFQMYCDDIEIVGEGEDVKSGIKIIQSQKPEVVFLDIHLTDGTGFEILKYFTVTGAFNFHVIFITAYDQYAIKAFKYSAVDYILKPIDPDELCTAIEKIRSLKSMPMSQERLKLMFDNINLQNSSSQKIALATMGSINIYKISEIIRCESQDNYTQFYFLNDKPLLVSRTLKDFEELLQEHGFERVHQSHLVNLNYIKTYQKADGGGLVLDNGAYIPVSQRKRDKLITRLKSL